ncbi:WXG100 family type VII secretion target [Actinoplanes sp. NPDC051494]|uniref:WXG100 family type VII secretion target n=1 Tax=Actinoplanes sp. NPDC051494 TaxID=3363907 RepID=UPI00378733C7
MRWLDRPRIPGPAPELATRKDLLSHWEGDAATAFNRELKEISASFADVAADFRGTADILTQSADAAAQAQDLVEQIVRELIAWLIVTIIVALASRTPLRVRPWWSVPPPVGSKPRSPQDGPGSSRRNWRCCCARSRCSCGR